MGFSNPKLTGWLGIFVCLALPAHAQNSSVAFKGNLCLEATSASCLPLGYGEGQCASARLMLPLEDGDSETRLSVFWPYESKTFSNTGENLLGEDFKTAETVFVGKSITIQEAGIRFVEQIPAEIDSATTQISVTGDITGFEQACFVRFRFLGQAEAPSPGSEPAVSDEESADNTFSNNGASYLRTIGPEAE